MREAFVLRELGWFHYTVELPMEQKTAWTESVCNRWFCSGFFVVVVFLPEGSVCSEGIRTVPLHRGTVHLLDVISGESKVPVLCQGCQRGPGARSRNHALSPFRHLWRVCVNVLYSFMVKGIPVQPICLQAPCCRQCIETQDTRERSLRSCDRDGVYVPCKSWMLVRGTGNWSLRLSQPCRLYQGKWYSTVYNSGLHFCDSLM